MFERIANKTIMVAEYMVFDEMIRFEKYLEGGTVNIFINENEVDMFTNYEIKQNEDRFHQACEEYLKEEYQGD